MTRKGAALAASATMLLLLGLRPAGAETIALFTKSAGNPIARVMRAGAEAMAKAYGVTLFHYIPTSPDNVAQQVGLMGDALRGRADAIVFTPVDVNAVVPTVERMNAAGIPLINIGDRVAGGNIVSFVGTDDYSIAVGTARTLFAAMHGKGNLVVLEGPPDTPTAVSRLRGFKDALKEFPDIRVVASKSATYTRQTAVDVVAALLKTRPPPQIDGVLAANDAMAFGAIEAFDAVKKSPLVAGINASEDAIIMIRAGDMLASGDYHGLVEGCLGVEIAIRTLRRLPVPKEVLAKTAVVDASNYQSYELPAERRPCPTLESMTAK